MGSRSSIRYAYGIEAKCSDCCVHLFCLECAHWLQDVSDAVFGELDAWQDR